MNFLKRALIVAALAGAAGQACAQAQPSPFADTPLYIGVTYGQAHWRTGCFDTARCDDTNTSVRGLGGWQINKYFAAEIGYHNFSQISSPGYFVKANAWEIVGIAAWPVLFDGFSVYGKAGAYRGAAENNNPQAGVYTNNNGTYGLGAAYELTRNLGVRFEWQSYMQISGGQVGPRSDIDVISLGVLWRFRQ